MKSKLALLILCLFGFTVSGQEMVTELFDRDRDKDSNPAGFVEFRDKLFFAATEECSGREVWVSDGASAEAYLLKDLYPGTESGLRTTFSEVAVVLNGLLYFIAADEHSAGELWKTDGTPAGTQRVTEAVNGAIDKLTLVGDRIYFLVKRGYFMEVWVSDGTKTGTRIVKEEVSTWGTPSYQGKVNDTFVFTFRARGSNNSRVWRSDGTEAGTYPITEEIDGNGSAPGGTSGLTQYIEYRDELYFVSRYYLHKTDGTKENTEIVTSFHEASNRLIEHGDVAEANGKLYFSFFEAYRDRLFIWETDGTAAGSTRVYDAESVDYFMPSNLLPWGDSLLFCGLNRTGGTSLLSMDLTDHAVTEIKELAATAQRPFFVAEGAVVLQRIGDDEIFCSVVVDHFRREGWLSSLTEESTRRVPELDRVDELFQIRGSSYYAHYGSATGDELWRTNIVHDSFYLLHNINTGKFGVTDQALLVMDSTILFAENDRYPVNTFWSLDGDDGGLTELNTGSTRVVPSSPLRINGQILLVLRDTIHGYELWSTDGTPQGTRIVQDIVEGRTSSFPMYLTAHRGNAYFTVGRDGIDYLYKTDGTDVDFLKEMGENSYGVPIGIVEMVSSGDYLYFVTDAEGHDLWRSDGTTAGTEKVRDFIECDELTDVDGELFFAAQEVVGGERELWSSAGADSTTRMVLDIGSGYTSNPRELHNYRGTLVFTAQTREWGREVWRSDGTPEGTSQIADINPGPPSAVAQAKFCVAGDQLYFRSHNGSDGYELWTTDGSAEGTAMLRDIHAGAGSSLPDALESLNDTLYFQAYDAEHGFELWRSDGTSAGTQLLADVLPGPASSFPARMTLLNDELYFIAKSRDAGRQIWKLSSDTATTATYLPPHFTTAPVYPNPTTGRIHLPGGGSEGPVRIYSAAGRLLRSELPRAGGIDIGDLPAGTYFLRRTVEGRSAVSTVVKQ